MGIKQNSYREVFSYKCSHWKNKNISYQQPNFTLKEVRKNTKKENKISPKLAEGKK